ncbi:transposase family protein [Micromonospora chersina]|uniref:transposase family protein n=1 Tax=Micromonospora chersina TaxID=47854 RepID=UPI00379A0CB7
MRQATAEFAGQVRSQAKRSAVIVDGFLAPTGERTGVAGMFSGKRHQVGFNIQAVADLAGRLVDTGLPVPGARHDSKALTESGIADRWATHLRPRGPGMLADLGYLGTNANRHPQATRP